MPLDQLISLLAEAAVRKLSQEREKKEATPDAVKELYRDLAAAARDFRQRRKRFAYLRCLLKTKPAGS